MNSVYLTTIVSILILVLLTVKGTVKVGKKFTENDFLSVKQTNWLKGIAILMIMYSHFYPLMGLTYSDGLFSFVLNLGYMGVAVFFLLSGYGALISKKNKPDYLKHYLLKRVIRLFLPFLAVFMLEIIIMIIQGEPIQLSYFYRIPIMSLPNTINWYLKIQLALYVVFFLAAKLFKNNNQLIIAVFIICIIYMIVGFLTGITSHWYETIFAFPVGMLLAEYRDALFCQYQKKKVFIVIVSPVIFVACNIPYFLKGGTLFEILFIVGFLVLVLFICLLTYGDSKLLALMGKSSLELYLIHGVINSLFISKISFSECSLVVYILVLLAYLSVSILTGWLLNKYITKLSRLIIRKL